VYVKEVAMAMVDAGHQVDIVTRRIIDPDWPEFPASIDHYSTHAPDLRIIRIPCGGDTFLAKEQLWEHLDEFVAGAIEFYANTLPDFVTAHYADGGYCAVLMQSRTGLRFTFTGHSLGAQKMDKLGMNSANASEMEQRFCFSKRIAAERAAMSRAFRIITSTGQERMEQYAHPLYAGAVDVHDDAKFSVIPPGVNTQVFSTQAGEADQSVNQKLSVSLSRPDQPHLLLASRIDEKKNIGGAVAAYVKSPELQQKAGFVICTRGIDKPFEQIESLSAEEQEVLKPILEMISAAGLRDRVEFLDVQSQTELAATYRYFAAWLAGSAALRPAMAAPPKFSLTAPACWLIQLMLTTLHAAWKKHWITTRISPRAPVHVCWTCTPGRKPRLVTLSSLRMVRQVVWTKVVRFRSWMPVSESGLT